MGIHPSADGIVFTATINTQKGIWVVDVTGANLHIIPLTLANADPAHAVVTLGDLILFFSSNDGMLYTIPPTGGMPTVVFTSAADVYPNDPDWSPDAGQVVFCERTRLSPYLWDLKSVNLGTGAVTSLVPPGTAQLYYPAWSRLGDRIAYNSGTTIYTVTPTTNPTPVKVVGGQFPYPGRPAI